MEMSDNLKEKIEKLKDAVSFMDDVYLKLDSILYNISDHDIEQILGIDPWAGPDQLLVKYMFYDRDKENYEIASCNIPFVWLDDDYDYMSDWHKQLEEENRAEEEKRKREEEEHDLKEYERLKKKFGDV